MIKNAINNLTKREKILVATLLVVILVTFLVLVIILPAITSLSDKRTEVAELQNKEIVYQDTIAQADKYVKMYEETKNILNETKDKFYLPMTPEELDSTITTMIIQSGLQPQDLEMSILGSRQFGAYVAPEADIKSTLRDLSEALARENENEENNDSDNIEAEVTQEGNVNAYRYTIKAVARGEWRNLSNLIDRANGTSALELTGYQFSKSESDSYIESIVNKPTATMFFNVYVYAGPSESKS